jgi:hypothetical protein
MTSLSSPTSEVDLVLQKSILAQAHKKYPARNGLRVPCRAEKSAISFHCQSTHNQSSDVLARCMVDRRQFAGISAASLFELLA